MFFFVFSFACTFLFFVKAAELPWIFALHGIRPCSVVTKFASRVR